MCEQSGQALGGLTQPHRNHQTPIIYYSLMLDPAAKAYPPHLGPIAASSKLVDAPAQLVLGLLFDLMGLRQYRHY